MATFKAVIIRHHKKDDGTFNVKIRITHQRKTRYIATPIHIASNEVTKNLKIKNQIVIDQIETIVTRYRRLCNKLGEKIESMTTDQIIEQLKNSNERGFHLDFLKFGREKTKEIKASGRTGTARNYETALNTLEKFIRNRKTLDIKELTTVFLKKYIAWTGGNRASSLYAGALRSLHNMAKDEYNDEDSGEINITQSPFKKLKIQQLPAKRQRALAVEYIQAIIHLDYEPEKPYQTSRFNLAKDVFLLSFCLKGMNAVDLYACTDMKKDRITYNRAKTSGRRRDRAEMSVKIEPEIQHLIEKYRNDTGTPHVFKFHKLYSTINNFNAALNKGLKKIGTKLGIDDLEFYAARHSWATIASNDCEIDKYLIHESLNHVSREMRETDLYIKKDYTRQDVANRKVLDLVFGFASGI